MHRSIAFYVVVACYLIVACIFFVLGKATTPPEVRNASFSALASLLWPIACIAVVVRVVYEKWKGNVER